jgi:hypothetical protein
MNRLVVSCYSVLALVALIGCEKKPEPTPPASDTPAAQAPAPAAAAPDKALAATSIDLEKIAVEEQFEKEMEAEVTPANFEQQLDTLEKELKAE